MSPKGGLPGCSDHPSIPGPRAVLARGACSKNIELVVDQIPQRKSHGLLLAPSGGSCSLVQAISKLMLWMSVSDVSVPQSPGGIQQACVSAVVDCTLLHLVLAVNPIHAVSTVSPSKHGSHSPLKAFVPSYLQLIKGQFLSPHTSNSSLPIFQGQLQLSCPGNIIPSAMIPTHLDLC